jgi:hypothetical protein
MQIVFTSTNEQLLSDISMTVSFNASDYRTSFLVNVLTREVPQV